MKSGKPIIQWREEAGQPIHTLRGDIIPISRSLFIRFPFGGFVWNRPVAINFIRNGQNQRVPVIDRTRKVIIMIVSVGILIPTIIKILTIFNNHKTKS